MKLCAYIQTEDKQSVAIFTRHGKLYNGLFIHREVDAEGRPAEQTALMVRFRDKALGNTVYADLVAREGYHRVKTNAASEANLLNLVRDYLPQCVALS